MSVSDLNLVSGETYYFSVFGLTEENVSSDTVRSDGVLIDNENPVVSIVTESSGAFQNQSAYMGNDFSSYPTINDVSVSANFSNAPLTMEWWMKNQKWDKAGTFWVFSMLNILVTFQNMDNEIWLYRHRGIRKRRRFSRR